MKDKVQLRKEAMELRKTLNIPGVSYILVNKIKEHNWYKNAQNVLIYYPFKYEIDLLPLLNDDKNFFLPRVNGKDLEVCSFRSGDYLKKSNFGILEPISMCEDPRILDLIIVPALMVSKDKYRLGYGGGYYDRFLKRYYYIKTMVPIFKELLIDHLPVESHDIKIDCIINT